MRLVWNNIHICRLICARHLQTSVYLILPTFGAPENVFSTSANLAYNFKHNKFRIVNRSLNILLNLLRPPKETENKYLASCFYGLISYHVINYI
jgi:hypothetical protein